MFSRFVTSDGVFFVRSDAVWRLEDTTDGACVVAWLEGSEAQARTIQGSAEQNYERLIKEELTAFDEAQRRQQRVESGHPIIPVRRGRL